MPSHVDGHHARTERRRRDPIRSDTKPTWAADHPAALALQAAIWGDRQTLIDAIDSGRFTVDLFLHPLRSATAAAVMQVVTSDSADLPSAVYHRLVGYDMAPHDAAEAIFFGPSTIQTPIASDGLDIRLEQLAQENLWRRCALEVAKLEESLLRSCGARRVAARLGIKADRH